MVVVVGVFIGSDGGGAGSGWSCRRFHPYLMQTINSSE